MSSIDWLHTRVLLASAPHRERVVLDPIVDALRQARRQRLLLLLPFPLAQPHRQRDVGLEEGQYSVVPCDYKLINYGSGIPEFGLKS